MAVSAEPPAGRADTWRMCAISLCSAWAGAIYMAAKRRRGETGRAAPERPAPP